jgi:hypothetical protein
MRQRGTGSFRGGNVNESERRQMHESDLDQKRESRAEYMPTLEEIAAWKVKIREENRVKQQGKKPQQEVDLDCDAELERQADIESRRRGRKVGAPNVYRLPEIDE